MLRGNSFSAFEDWLACEWSTLGALAGMALSAQMQSGWDRRQHQQKPMVGWAMMIASAERWIAAPTKETEENSKTIAMCLANGSPVTCGGEPARSWR